MFDNFHKGVKDCSPAQEFLCPKEKNAPFSRCRGEIALEGESNSNDDYIRTMNYSASQLQKILHLKMRNEIEIQQKRQQLLRMLMQKRELREFMHKLDQSHLFEDEPYGHNNPSMASYSTQLGKTSKGDESSWPTLLHDNVGIHNNRHHASTLSMKHPGISNVNTDRALWTRYGEKMSFLEKREQEELARDLLELYNLQATWEDSVASLPKYLHQTKRQNVRFSTSHIEKTKISNTELFKTEMCENWTEFGMCPYGNICRFAHGIGELRTRPKPHKYKTERCKKFLAGYCPYGSRCCFVHDASEQQSSQGCRAEDEKLPEQNRGKRRRWRPTPLYKEKKLLQI